MTDLIEQAEQQLVTDVDRGFITEAHVLLGKLIEAYKELYEGCAEASRVSAIIQTEQVTTIDRLKTENAALLRELFYSRYKPGINDAWPGDPGAAD